MIKEEEEEEEEEQKDERDEIVAILLHFRWEETTPDAERFSDENPRVFRARD